MEEEPWIVGSVLEMPKEERWQRPKKVAHEKVKFIQEYGGPVKISTGCVEECCVKESRRSMQRTLDAWMQRRSGVTVKNKFAELQVGAVDDDEEEDIAAVNERWGRESDGGQWSCEERVAKAEKGSAEEEVGQEAQARRRTERTAKPYWSLRRTGSSAG